MLIYRAALRHLETVKPLFHSYRQFYKPESVRAESDAFITKRLTDPNSVIFIAEIDGAPAGLAQLYFSRSSVSVRSELLLNDLYVNPQFRKHGVGSKLIATCREFAMSQNIFVLKLETSSTNATAKKLYESLGWELETGSDFYELQIPKSEATTLKKQPYLKDVLPQTLKLNAQTAVLTSATGAVGKKIVANLTQRGFTILGCGRDSTELQALATTYPKSEFTIVNVAHGFGVQDWATYLLTKYGVPGYVINNNADFNPKTTNFSDTSVDEAKEIIDQQLLGTINVSRAFMPAMSLYKNKTNIINILPATAEKTTASNPIINSANCAIEGFTQAIAAENADSVTVFCVVKAVSHVPEFCDTIINSNPTNSGKTLKLGI